MMPLIMKFKFEDFLKKDITRLMQWIWPYSDAHGKKCKVCRTYRLWAISAMKKKMVKLLHGLWNCSNKTHKKRSTLVQYTEYCTSRIPISQRPYPPTPTSTAPHLKKQGNRRTLRPVSHWRRKRSHQTKWSNTSSSNKNKNRWWFIVKYVSVRVPRVSFFFYNSAWAELVWPARVLE